MRGIFPKNNEDKESCDFANQFARELLMPRECVIEYWHRYKDVSILAEKFGVLLIHMQYRLEELGLI